MPVLMLSLSVTLFCTLELNKGKDGREQGKEEICIKSGASTYISISITWASVVINNVLPFLT